MEDLTVIYITINKVPQKWAAYHREMLLKAVGSFPLITISEKPMDMPGLNLSQAEYEKSSINVTFQILRGAKEAKTQYVAVAEDDTLYTPEHFRFFRPPLDSVSYNHHRWSLFTWGEPMYSYRQARGNCSLIAPRNLVVEAFSERFNKYPNKDNHALGGEIGRPDIEGPLGVTRRKSMDVWSNDPIISLRHEFSLEATQQNHTKKHTLIRAYDIPYWRKAEDLVKKFI